MSFDWRIERFDTLISTQNVVKERAVSGETEGFVAQALTQSGGQGRHGRVWESPQGNLYMSMLLRPECGVRFIGQLSLITAIALARTIGRKEELQLKWPNDVLLSGKKCAGILLESELGMAGQVDWVVIGAGVNIASAPPEIGACLGADIDVDDFRDRFLGEFLSIYNVWREGSFDCLRQEWLGLAHPQGQSLSVKIGERLESGLFHDIDGDGNLRLRQDDGELKVITSGDVYVAGD